jgi:FkbM family methyltransferase
MNPYKRLKFFIKIILNREVYYKTQIVCETQWYGNKNAGFFVIPGLLNKDSVVYSCGIGEDISFDKGLIKEFNCKVYGFDPTPKTIKFIEKEKMNQNFKFYPYGISDHDGFMQFFLPKNPFDISGTSFNRWGYDETKYGPIEVPVKKFSTIAKELGHRKIDVLKLDIEGSEYSVLDDIFNSTIEINQLLIEFHHRFKNVGVRKTKVAIKKIIENGFLIAAISEHKEEYTFLKMSS